MFRLDQLMLICILLMQFRSLVHSAYVQNIVNNSRLLNFQINRTEDRNKLSNDVLAGIEHVNKTSRLQEEDEDYEDNEGIDDSSDDDAEGAEQEEGDDDGGGDEADGDEGDGGDDEGGGDEPADEPGDDGPSESPPDDGGDEPAEPGGPGDPGMPGTPPDGGSNCPNPDTIFSTANAWRVRLLSQICQLSNYLLNGFHFKYKYIIKKLQHLIGLLSYNQSNMNLEEMVRFLTSVQTTYNQVLTGYLGVFYILKKCQYKQMCFDCAVITGQLQKLMMETNYTSASTDLNHIHFSNRTLVYLKSKFKNKKSNHTNHELKKMKKKKKQTFTIHQVNNNSVNLTEILKINTRLYKEFDKLIRQVKKKQKRDKNEKLNNVKIRLNK